MNSGASESKSETFNYMLLVFISIL